MKASKGAQCRIHRAETSLMNRKSSLSDTTPVLAQDSSQFMPVITEPGKSSSPDMEKRKPQSRQACRSHRTRRHPMQRSRTNELRTSSHWSNGNPYPANHAFLWSI
ncbi:hypothetical protein I7I50_00224 [Histoplasma capsulatum G186AR]|uniref:Uncharacterized protein n=1 Tax=Ajellomyces capsulatus TaxID=5037 RepID=A0A8H7YFU2_AJECA|nr:hypothetical protein I7I52_07493 [Histoplasma capsulatum]QSS72394.1 hypothetical protein I7I50_00224 [Histoplasma capsulatum G186AR]